MDVESKNSVLKNYPKLLTQVNEAISQSIQANAVNDIQSYRKTAIDLLEKFVNCLDMTDYLLIDSNPEIPKKTYVDSYFTLGTLYKSYVETEIESKMTNLRLNKLHRTDAENEQMTNAHQKMLHRAIECFRQILGVNFEDELATKQIISVFTHLCFFVQNDTEKSLHYMHDALVFAADSPTIHYNLGFLYQRANRLEQSLVHYQLSLRLTELEILRENAKELEGAKENRSKKHKNKQLTQNTNSMRDEHQRMQINNYNGLSAIYRSIKQWPQALFYSLQAESIRGDDPDIQNQLGVIYTEMRRTDLAEIAYNKAITNYTKSVVSTDHKFLLAELYLNLGHMHSYNGDNNKSIECYNKSLQTCPKFALPFQNKIMNLSYLFDELDDKMYIYNQHKLVNRLYKKGDDRYKFNREFYKTDKINIGIISGDFVDHPVSYFISTFLKCFDTSRFNVTCYSECIINTALFNRELQFKTIRNMSAEDASALIYNDRVHILFDLAGHTAHNRLDVFAMKPSPIQITYIGYPYSTGLNEMDYRITDNICDGDLTVSSKFYTERLLCLQNCFLCYDPQDIKTKTKKFHELQSRKYKVGERDLVIGCFNRVNKITDSVIKIFNKILLRYDWVKFVFKTKALLNNNVKTTFLSKFDKTVRSRITVLDCTISHDSHLLTYNSVDISIDTFPYSGTTTTCESLYMGVPVFSMYDSTYYFHAQNVSCSILKNSNLDYYVVDSEDELLNKIQEVHNSDRTSLKSETRNKFLNGKVCDKQAYMSNLQALLDDLYRQKIKEL